MPGTCESSFLIASIFCSRKFIYIKDEKGDVGGFEKRGESMKQSSRREGK